jgi:hypothetical protein
MKDWDDTSLRPIAVLLYDSLVTCMESCQVVERTRRLTESQFLSQANWLCLVSYGLHRRSNFSELWIAHLFIKFQCFNHYSKAEVPAEQFDPEILMLHLSVTSHDIISMRLACNAELLTTILLIFDITYIQLNVALLLS